MDLMEIDDGTHLSGNIMKESLITRVDLTGRNRPSKYVYVGLGLLVALLLAGNLAQFVYNNNLIHLMSAEKIQAGTAEKLVLEGTLTNMTEGKDQLLKSYNSLKQERDQIQKNHSDVLKSFDKLRREKDELDKKFSSLESDKDRLQQSYDTLKQEKDQLPTNCSSLQNSLSNLQQEKNNLQTQLETMTTNRDNLQRTNTALRSQNDELQSSHDSLQRDRDQLQIKYNVLVNAKDELQKKIDDMDKPCESGWKKFGSRCFYISTLRKSWENSRDYCISQGAQLAIIDNKDKQVFLNGVVKSPDEPWFGLSDRMHEGHWNWIDDRNISTTAYWAPGRPDSYAGDAEDCAEFWPNKQIGSWNDEPCTSQNTFICEKTF